MARWRLLLVLAALLPTADAAAAAAFEVERLAGDALRLRLPPELGSSWREVNLARLRLRAVSEQRSLERSSLPATPELTIGADAPGCSLLEVDAGPPVADRRGDAWQRVSRCLKIVRCQPGAGAVERRRAGPLMTAKTGSRIEIRPLLNPLVLLPGSDLPVRLYFGGESSAGSEVVARGPAGTEVRAASDAVGIAVLRIPVAGLWRLSFSARGASAELIFDVPES